MFIPHYAVSIDQRLLFVLHLIGSIAYLNHISLWILQMWDEDFSRHGNVGIMAKRELEGAALDVERHAQGFARDGARIWTYSRFQRAPAGVDGSTICLLVAASDPEALVFPH